MFIVVVSVRWSDDDPAARLQNLWRGRGKGRPHPGRPRPAPSRLRFCFDEHKQLIRTAMLSFLSGSRERKVSPGFFFTEMSCVFLSSAHLDATGRRRRILMSPLLRPTSRAARQLSSLLFTPATTCGATQNRTDNRTNSPDTFYSLWTDKTTETNQQTSAARWNHLVAFSSHQGFKSWIKMSTPGCHMHSPAL